MQSSVAETHASSCRLLLLFLLLLSSIIIVFLVRFLCSPFAISSHMELPEAQTEMINRQAGGL